MEPPSSSVHDLPQSPRRIGSGETRNTNDVHAFIASQKHTHVRRKWEPLFLHGQKIVISCFALRLLFLPFPFCPLLLKEPICRRRDCCSQHLSSPTPLQKKKPRSASPFLLSVAHRTDMEGLSLRSQDTSPIQKGLSSPPPPPKLPSSPSPSPPSFHFCFNNLLSPSLVFENSPGSLLLLLLLPVIYSPPLSDSLLTENPLPSLGGTVAEPPPSEGEDVTVRTELGEGGERASPYAGRAGGINTGRIT